MTTWVNVSISQTALEQKSNVCSPCQLLARVDAITGAFFDRIEPCRRQVGRYPNRFYQEPPVREKARLPDLHPLYVDDQPENNTSIIILAGRMIAGAGFNGDCSNDKTSSGIYCSPKSTHSTTL